MLSGWSVDWWPPGSIRCDVDSSARLEFANQQVVVKQRRHSGPSWPVIHKGHCEWIGCLVDAVVWSAHWAIVIYCFTTGCVHTWRQCTGMWSKASLTPWSGSPFPRVHASIHRTVRIKPLVCTPGDMLAQHWPELLVEWALVSIWNGWITFKERNCWTYLVPHRM